MAMKEISSKYLSGKRKQIIEWDERNGNVKIKVVSADGSTVEKETLMEATKKA